MGSRLLACTFLFITVSLPTLAQIPGSQQPQQEPPMEQPRLDVGTQIPADDATARMSEELERKAEVERVAQLKSDTDKLLKLSVELKTYVDKTNTNVLSLDVMKKAEEIEKLAKSVRDKMRGPN